MPARVETLLERFRRVTARHPGNVAVADGRRSLTYAELDAATDDLASRIQAYRRGGAGVGAYLAGRGLAEVVCMWGVLKAGLAFAPLDPEAPTTWLDPVLDELDADILVVDPAHAPLAAAVSRTDIPRLALTLDISAPTTREAHDAPALTVTGDTRGWITYTSGSTGTPKGVVQDHATIVRIADAYAGVLALSPHDRVLLLHPTMTWDIFGALATGAGLCPFDILGGGAQGLARWIDEQRVTVYRSFPTTFRAFLHALDGDAAFPSVRAVHLSGETVTSDDVALFERHFPQTAVLHHVFGSAEAGPVAACRIARGSATPGKRLPLGPPLDAVEVTVRGEAGEPLPRGERGEIVVRSPFVATGYWKRAEQTRAAFTLGEGLRGFRTGDLGSWDEAGQLYHHGRADGQLKIRGARVEPGHVETVLRRHPLVTDVAVTTVTSPAGERQLGAVVAARAGFDGDTARAHAAAHLPPALVPQHVVVVAQLPQTANGKVDRLALAPLLLAGIAAAMGTQARPLTPDEVRMARCWCQAFGRDDIGIDDDFLSVGGDSLTAVRLAAVVLREFGVAVSFEAILDTGTPAALTAHLANRPAS